MRLALAIVLLLQLSAFAETKNVSANANELRILIPDAPSSFVVREPIGLSTKDVVVVTRWEGEGAEARPASWGHACVFFTGNHKRIVIESFANGPVVPAIDQYVITIKGGKPDEDDDEDADEDDKKPDDRDDEDDDKPLPSTEYNVGPAVARGFATVPKSAKVDAGKVFGDVAQRLEQTRHPVATARKEVFEGLKRVRDASPKSSFDSRGNWKPFEAYKQAFADGWKKDRVVTIEQHVGAYREVAAWLRK